MILLGFDPGRDKCGLAVVETPSQALLYHQVIPSEAAIEKLKSLCQEFPIATLVMGNQTTAQQWQKKIEVEFPQSPPLALVDERHSSLEGRERYWQMYPPRGLTRLLPPGMRLPPRPIDDIVAILLVERYLQK